MLLASLFYSAGTLFVVLVQSRISVPQIILFRNLFALGLIAPYFLKNREVFRTKCLKLHVVRGLLAYVNVSLFYLSLRYLNFVDATVLNTTYAFFVPFVSYFWLKESMPMHIWWAIGLGFLGIILIVQPNWDIFYFGSLVALCSAITAAFSFSSVRSLNLKNEPPIRSYFFFYLIGSVIVFPFAIGEWTPPSFEEWIYLFLLSVSMGINQILLTKAYQLGPASYIAPVTYSTIAFAAIMNWVIFNQSIGIGSLLGSLLIVIGGSLTFYQRKKQEARTTTF